MKDKIADILKAYTKKHGISASFVILEDYAEELVKNGCVIQESKVETTANESEIMKALECLTKIGDTDLTCDCCKYCSAWGCDGESMWEDFLDLLNRKNAENASLTKECGYQSTLWRAHFESVFESAKEVVKEEAIKEFAERVKAERFCHGGDLVYVDTIDQIAKEMGVEL